MIKVSFIAIVLAAIGYKEYNPSVVGKWELKNSKYHQMHFNEKGECILIHKYMARDYTIRARIDSTSYSYINGILKIDSVRNEEKAYTIVRQNKRKLILRRSDIEHGSKIVYKRMPTDQIVCMLPEF